MRITSLLLGLLATLPTSTWAADPVWPASAIPEKLKAGAHAVVRLEVQHYQIESRKRYTLRDTTVITILDREGLDAATVGMSYDSYQKLTQFEVTVYDANGKRIRKLRSEEITDYNPSAFDLLSYDQVRVKIARPVEGSFPYTIVAVGTVESDGMYDFPDWTPKNSKTTAVECQRLRFETPPNFRLQHEALNGMVKPTVRQQDGKQMMLWQLDQLSVTSEREYFTPHPDDYRARLLVTPGEFELFDQPGMRDNWQNYGNWINQISKDRIVISPEEAAKIKQLVADAPNDRARIDRVYAYMQGRMRYIAVYYGLGGLQPHAATETSKNAYGDCKDLSTYTQAMLQAAGVTAHPVLIQRGILEPTVSASFASHQFNHMILAVPQGKDTLWLECTSNDAPTAYLGPDDEDRRVLVITPEGGKLAMTPHAPAEANRSVWRTTAQLTETGGLNATVQSQHTGHQGMLMRQLAELKPTEVEQFWQHQLRSPFTTLKCDYSGAGRRAEPAHVKLSVNAPNYANRAGTRLLVNPNVLARKQVVLPEDANREQELVLTFPYLHRQEQLDTVRIQVPEGLILDSSFPGADLKTDFAQYRAAAQFDPATRTLTYTRFFRWTQTRFPAKRYNEVRQFLQQVEKADKALMVLTKGT